MVESYWTWVDSCWAGFGLVWLLVVRLLGRGLHQGLDALERCLRDLDGNVRVALRGAQLRMTEHTLDRERAGALRVQQRSATVARIVEADSRYFGAAAERAERLADVALV